MARLNEIFESDEELPELSTILRATEIDDIKPAGTDVVNKHSYKRSAAAKTNPSHMISTNTPCDEKIPWKQWQLGTQKPPGVRPSHLPDSKQAIASAKDEKVRSIDKSSARSSPNKLTKTSLNYLNYNQHVSDLSSASILTSDDGHSCTELSDFTVPDSASDEESIVESPRKGVRRSPAKSKLRLMPSRTISETRQSPEIVDLLSEKKKPSVICLESPPRQRSPSMGSDRAEIRSTLNDRFTQLKW